MKHIFYLILLTILAAHTSSAQVITTYAGGGVSGDGSMATSALINNPIGGTFDRTGNYYVASGVGGHCIKKIDLAGIITTVAGNGIQGFSGDGGPAVNAKLSAPGAVATDTLGNIYIVDCLNNRIRKVTKATGIITTFAGNGLSTSTGDGGPATAASINSPADLCFDKFGNLYVSESLGARVRRISPTGIIDKFAGTGIVGYSGDGSQAVNCKLGTVGGLCADGKGNIYIADAFNSRVFKVSTDGTITTVAGTATGYLFNGDDLAATRANIDPIRIRTDKFGNLFIAEHLNYRLRRVDNRGYIHTVAGLGTAGVNGDGGPATAAQLSYPLGVTLDTCGNIYIPEANNNRIRKITYPICNALSATNSPIPNSQFLELYPNPATYQLHITLPNTTYTTLTITNYLGQLMLQQAVSGRNLDIDVQRYPQGIYYMVLSGSEGVEVRRFVKM